MLQSGRKLVLRESQGSYDVIERLEAATFDSLFVELEVYDIDFPDEVKNAFRNLFRHRTKGWDSIRICCLDWRVVLSLVSILLQESSVKISKLYIDDLYDVDSGMVPLLVGDSLSSCQTEIPLLGFPRSRLPSYFISSVMQDLAQKTSLKSLDFENASVGPQRSSSTTGKTHRP